MEMRCWYCAFVALQLFRNNPQLQQVTVNVSILAFPEIDTLELSYTSDFILLIKWIDPRLVFYNLRDQYDMNALSKSIQGKIWAPALSFPNARQAEGTVVDELSLTRIVRNGNSLKDDITNAVESNRFLGLDSPIIMTREYFVKFNCDFDLLMYPFDTQVNIQYTIMNTIQLFLISGL